jgi:hypothetical protein
MKAIVQEGYGSPDVLKLREVEMPAAGDDGVLVEVHAASVNALDWHLARGVPIFIRILEAIGAPKYRIRGVDLAGRVTAVGKSVMRSKPGDEVLGGADDSFAEFTAITEKGVRQSTQVCTRTPGFYRWVESPDTTPIRVRPNYCLQDTRDRFRPAAATSSSAVFMPERATNARLYFQLNIAQPYEAAARTFPTLRTSLDDISYLPLTVPGIPLLRSPPLM